MITSTFSSGDSNSFEASKSHHTNTYSPNKSSLGIKPFDKTLMEISKNLTELYHISEGDDGIIQDFDHEIQKLDELIKLLKPLTVRSSTPNIIKTKQFDSKFIKSGNNAATANGNANCNSNGSASLNGVKAKDHSQTKLIIPAEPSKIAEKFSKVSSNIQPKGVEPNPKIESSTLSQNNNEQKTVLQKNGSSMSFSPHQRGDNSQNKIQSSERTNENQQTTTSGSFITLEEKLVHLINERKLISHPKFDANAKKNNKK